MTLDHAGGPAHNTIEATDEASAMVTRRGDGGRDDPFTALDFIIEIDSLAEVGFSTCRLGGSTTERLTYREGTDIGGPRALPGSTRYEPVTLERGVTCSAALADWRRLVERGEIAAARRPVTVVLLDEEADSGPQWELTAAWPMRYVGPRLDALDGGVAIERLVLAHEGIERVAE